MNLTNEQILLMVEVLTSEVVRIEGIGDLGDRQSNLIDCINHLMSLVVKGPND